MGFDGVSPSKYQTCICGRVCKGRSALATHGRKCLVARVRSAMTVYCASENLPHLSDAALLRKIDSIHAAMIALPYGHPAAGMVCGGECSNGCCKVPAH